MHEPEDPGQRPAASQPPDTRRVVGTVAFVLVVILGLFFIMSGGFGLLLLLFLFDDGPLAGPGILLFLLLICLPLGLVVWGQGRAGQHSRPLRLPGPLPIA